MSRKRFAVCLVFFFGLLLLDFFSKKYVVSHILPLESIEVFGSIQGIKLSLEYVKNTGAAWGIFSSLQTYLLWVRVLIIAGLVAWICFGRISIGHRTIFSLIALGALGNVVDFFLYGHVVDMFHFSFFGYSYPVFNIADSMIFCGVASLLMDQFFEKKAKNSSGNIV